MFFGSFSMPTDAVEFTFHILFVLTHVYLNLAASNQFPT
jgi:hypothetical protein